MSNSRMSSARFSSTGSFASSSRRCCRPTCGRPKRAQLGHRPSGHGDREHLACLGAAEDLADSRFGAVSAGSRACERRVAIVLPESGGGRRRGIRGGREAVAYVLKGSGQGNSPPPSTRSFPHRGTCSLRAGGGAAAGGAGGGGAGGRFRASRRGGRAGGGRRRSLPGYGWSWRSSRGRGPSSRARVFPGRRR